MLSSPFARPPVVRCLVWWAGAAVRAYFRSGVVAGVVGLWGVDGAARGGSGVDSGRRCRAPSAGRWRLWSLGVGAVSLF